MLINCPRCGFSQPQDQYCAQCGVDMQSFKQKKQPLIGRIFGNAGVQIGILLVIAVFIGQYIFRSQEPQNWVQKITHFQGMSKSNRGGGLPGSASDRLNQDQADAENENLASANAVNQLESLRSQESETGQPGTNSAGIANSGINSLNAQGGAQDLSSINFKVTYAEISLEMLSKWVSDSSNLGLYQNLAEYSAGIIHDYKKRGDIFHQTLKSSDLPLRAGGTNSNLSGTMSADGSQMLGLITAIEYKSNENEVIRGNISVTKVGTQNSEVYPAEFDLPKGAIFFIIGALKRESFAAERAKLSMPPFQIFKSPDFMTRKTEFVIIVEPDYK